MNDKQQVVYEPHPVSEDRLAELQKQGVMIIDACFKPDDAPDQEVDKPAKRGRPAKAEPEAE